MTIYPHIILVLSSSFFATKLGNPRSRINGDILKKLNKLSYLLEISTVQKGSKQVSYIDQLSQFYTLEAVKFRYLTISPQIRVWDFPRNKYYCRVFACCDNEEYGRLKPYSSVYVGPKLDVLIHHNTLPDAEMSKFTFGGTLALKTQYVCYNVGSIYSDLQFNFDLNQAYRNSNMVLMNYSFVLAIGLKIRNSRFY